MLERDASNDCGKEVGNFANFGTIQANAGARPPGLEPRDGLDRECRRQLRPGGPGPSSQSRDGGRFRWRGRRRPV